MRYLRIRRRIKRKRSSASLRDVKRKRQSDSVAFNPVALLSSFADKEKRSPKLEVSDPGDKFEKEADTVAQQVVDNGPATEVKEKTEIDKQSKSVTNGIDRSFNSTLSQSKLSGKPIPGNAKYHMEQRMAADFSNVRIHTDSNAARMCQQVNAQAFAHGPHIYFNRGKYDPGCSKGKHLLAHELTHTIQQSAAIQRVPEKENTGKITGNFTFKVGSGLSSQFLKKAKTCIGDGPLTADEINILRIYAIAYRGTVTHAERLLMAALCVPANVAIVQADTTGTFNIPVNSITRANRQRVRKSGQETYPDSVAQLIRESFAALFDLSPETAAAKMLEAQKESAKVMLDRTGNFKKKMARVIAFCKGRNIPLTDVLQAMLNGGSDNSAGDKYLAALAYAVIRAYGHADASKFGSGTLKVDALSRKAYRKNVSKSSASYVTIGVGDVLKGDTLYLTTDLDIRNLTHRSLIVHEFIHAVEDHKAPNAQTVDEINDEIVAYCRQIKYILDEILRKPAGPARNKLIKGAAKNMVIGAYHWGFLLEARKDRLKYEALTLQVFQAYKKNYTAEIIANELAKTEAALKVKMRNSLDALPFYSKTGKTLQDGAKGPSYIDHIN